MITHEEATNALNRLWDSVDWGGDKDAKIVLDYVQQQAARDKDYNELIMAVASKYPGETRHQTALRHITERENRPAMGPCMSEEAAARARLDGIGGGA